MSLPPGGPNPGGGSCGAVFNRYVPRGVRAACHSSAPQCRRHGRPDMLAGPGILSWLESKYSAASPTSASRPRTSPAPTKSAANDGDLYSLQSAISSPRFAWLNTFRSSTASIGINLSVEIVVLESRQRGIIWRLTSLIDVLKLWSSSYSTQPFPPEN